MSDQVRRWDTSYEWKAVTLLSIGFALVGIDRWIIAPLFPAMMQDLNLTYQDLGNLVGVLAICWGVFSTLMGGVSDRIGRRKVLIPSILLFSLLAGLSGVVGSLMGLLVIRSIMGATEGAYCPTSAAATVEASEPRRRGFNLGIQFSMFALLGLGFGPIIATQLLSVVPSWRWVFVLVAIPGFILAAFMYAVLREPPHIGQKTVTAPVPWSTLLRSRNVLLGMLSLLCAMSGVFVLGAMIPSYLIDYLHLTPAQMGFVTSAIGFGGFFGELGVCGISDLLGRRNVAVASFILAAILVAAFSRIGADPFMLFCILFALSFFNFGLLGLLTGPVASEAVPATLTSSAIGLISGAGEIFGGGVAPSGAGYIAVHYGIQNVLMLALVGLSLGVVVSFFLIETSPRRARRAAAAMPLEARRT